MAYNKVGRTAVLQATFWGASIGLSTLWFGELARGESALCTLALGFFAVITLALIAAVRALDGEPAGLWACLTHAAACLVWLCLTAVLAIRAVSARTSGLLPGRVALSRLLSAPGPFLRAAAAHPYTLVALHALTLVGGVAALVLMIRREA